MKERNYQARIIYPTKLSFRYEEEIKTFPYTGAKGIHHHKSCITGNAEGGYLKQADMCKMTHGQTETGNCNLVE